MMTKRISSALAIAAFMLVAAAALKYAQGIQLIAADVPVRANQVIVGLVLALFGNFIPKDAGRSQACSGSPLQSALRVGGWSFTLAGLVYAGLSAFAPSPIGNLLAMATVAAATLITAAHAGWVGLNR
jgi:hypothetical protein